MWRLFFKISEGEMEGKTKNKSIDVYLYRNDLNLPLKDISYPLSHKDTFRLDNEIVRQIENAFYEED